MAMTEGGALEKRLGRRIQDFRKKAGLTQQDLCHKARLSYSTLAKIERGAIKSPSVFTMQSIAINLGVTLDELIGDTTNLRSREYKTSKTGVKFVYFDVNGSLVRYYQRAFSELARDLGLQPDIVETAFWFYSDELDKGQITAEEFNKLFAGRLGVDSINWPSYYIKAVEKIPGIDQLMNYVAENYHMGLLTNSYPGGLDDLIKAKLLPEVKLDVVVDSSKEGIIKPDQKIFKIAQKRAGLEPSEILLIDDVMANLVAAQKNGWHTLWFDSSSPEESIKNVLAALEPIK